MRDYQQTLDYIYSFVDFSLVRNLRYTPGKFNLQRMRDFAQALGNPQDQVRCIHVAGTKGKGSVCAMLASILKAAGYRVGLYTSPHMVSFTERIQVDGEEISRDAFCKLIDSLTPAIEKNPNISTFEITTAAAFIYFAQMKVDISIIEVGLGGRLDATNIVIPELSIITSISHDHTAILGNTFAKIANEKGGIIKENIPVVCSSTKKSVQTVLNLIAKEKNAEIYFIQDYLTYKTINNTINGQEIKINIHNLPESNETTRVSNSYFFHLPLLGPHQTQNAATTLFASYILKNKGWKINESAIYIGFNTTNWPGRFEKISEFPSIIIDSAHNDDSIRNLIKTAKSVLNHEDLIWLFGASEDKNINGMFKALSTITESIHLTKSEHPRAASLQILRGIADKWFKNVRVYESPEMAINLLTKEINKRQTIICAGSIFIAAAVRSIVLGKKNK